MEEFKWFARRPRDSSLSFEETKSRLACRFYDTNLAMETLRREWEEVGSRS